MVNVKQKGKKKHFPDEKPKILHDFCVHFFIQKKEREREKKAITGKATI